MVIWHLPGTIACSSDFSFRVFIGNFWDLNRPIHILGKKEPANLGSPHMGLFKDNRARKWWQFYTLFLFWRHCETVPSEDANSLCLQNNRSYLPDKKPKGHIFPVPIHGWLRGRRLQRHLPKNTHDGCSSFWCIPCLQSSRFFLGWTCFRFAVISTNYSLLWSKWPHGIGWYIFRFKIWM